MTVSASVPVKFPRSLLRKPSEDAAARVFCFPYSGVGASMFNQWPRMIGEVEICPVQLPARENRFREAHYGTYQGLAQNLADELLPYLDRPAVFFGHCAGSLPAFETALRLAEIGGPVPREVVVSAQVAPQHCPKDRFLDMTDEALGAELSQLVVARGGDAHPMLIELTLHVLHQDLDANRLYHRPEPTRLSSAITALTWREDREIEPGELTGWREWSEHVTFAELPGAHYAFLNAPPELTRLLHSLALPGAPLRTETESSPAQGHRR
ncbi:thioesterase domain-containing protein [Streptomyces coacervatus]|uniref:Thioesterase domain-containing protein n=1 Tax=Streptomyces coacervatus TaxID=647381 RepID=A0ABP7IWH9_9ACTN|nr:thioesterase domain-containing protein [Streptomyces coacervatus]MDF2269662.1 thioesterase domain-containing protein [Streptomyces coacervatus]